MAKFKVNADKFKLFLDTAACKGTLQFTSKSKVRKDMFEAFVITADIEENCLEILAKDNHYESIKERIVLTNVDVEQEGMLEITNKTIFDNIWKSIDTKKNIIVETKEGKTIITTEDGKDQYRIAQIANQDKIGIAINLQDDLQLWKKRHKKVNIDDKTLTRFEIEGKGHSDFEMRLTTTQDKLKVLTSDVLNLTEDNKTLIISENGKVYMHSGNPNDVVQSKHELEFSNTGTGWEDFKAKFFALQAIVPNLLKNVNLNIRRTGANTIILRFESQESDLVQEINVGSEGKDGDI